eukprot:TRINITY_DN10166_c0_g1_i3.p1 TRINITY_DN10166_c0_g1~~TRINITY_DN10166_c0_g1_i3.p1  ORF type:complete len:217 (+),score=41.60 TRINITY_DN10166_c0_g1_i3:59-652(+)
MKPGTQVWAKIDGFPWWPAKVIAPSEADSGVRNGKGPGQDVLIRYYLTNDHSWMTSSNGKEIVPLEYESSKATHKGKKLQDALALARKDKGQAAAKASAEPSKEKEPTEKVKDKKEDRKPKAGPAPKEKPVKQVDQKKKTPSKKKAEEGATTKRARAASPESDSSYSSSGNSSSGSESGGGGGGGRERGDSHGQARW